MKKIIIICCILVIAIFTLAGMYFSDLENKDNDASDVLIFIPNDASLIFSLKNDKSTFEIFQDYELFNGLAGDGHSTEWTQLKEIIQAPELTEALSNRNVFISLFHNGDSVSFLYGINIDRKLSERDFEEALKESSYNIKPLNNSIYEFRPNDIALPLYLLVNKGSVLVSHHKALIERCALNDQHRLDKAFMQEITKTLDRNLTSPLSLFINHRALQPFVRQFLNQNYPNLSLLKDLSGQSLLSMNFKSDAIMFNGLSVPEAEESSHINILLSQKPIAQTIQNIVPRDVAAYLAFGFSDMKQFRNLLHVQLEKHIEFAGIVKNIRTLTSTTGVDPDQEIFPLLGNEIVSIQNSNGHRLALIKLKNGREVNFKLQLISRPVSEKISSVSYPDLFYYYYGDLLKNFRKPYFSVIDNYLIISNSSSAISSYLRAYSDEDFLSVTDDYKHYTQLVANQSNILYFRHFKNSIPIIRHVLKKPFAENITGKLFRSQNAYGFSYQGSAEKDHFFSNFYLGYNSSDTIALSR